MRKSDADERMRQRDSGHNPKPCDPLLNSAAWVNRE